MHPTLSELESLVRQAGEILREGFTARPGMGKEHQIDFKSEIDLVTEIDFQSEAFLLEAIRSRYPGDRIVTEESGTHDGEGNGSWFIDPLDGTVNYAHGVPIFCVSVAYAENGQVRLGAVYNPLLDECFSAERGRGAWMNGDAIRVSTISELNKSLLVTGFPYDVRSNPENNLDLYARFALLSQGVRRLGSAALDLCYIAAGRLDGYWELQLFSWDAAAGGLIAEEAGARVTSVRGDAAYLTSLPSILAANEKVHAQMLAVLQENGAGNGRSTWE